MSIDIDWERLTTGPDGHALALTIRDFVHDRFQQVTLPRFIQSVQVHSFDFGKECPVVQLKDVCDPLPDFYDDDGDEQSEDDDANLTHSSYPTHSSETARSSQPAPLPPPSSKPPNPLEIRLPGPRSTQSLADQIATPLLSRSNTPGIPGGTSNLSYFHLPLSAGLSGSQASLAAVAGGTPYSAGWADHYSPPSWRPTHPSPQQRQDFTYADPSSRPSTSHSYLLPTPSPPPPPSTLLPEPNSPSSPSPSPSPSPSDLQITLHISYTGSLHLSLTAHILLDYPMPSFVGIPLKLHITGLSFDGVALLAYMSKRSRARFCFLAPADAEAVLGGGGGSELGGGQSATESGAGDFHHRHHDAENDRGDGGGGGGGGGLLRAIHVESEIGKQEGGKQVLKNVGKVEKFVLEQVRRIFEDEFVYPSFWTFLL